MILLSDKAGSEVGKLEKCMVFVAQTQPGITNWTNAETQSQSMSVSDAEIAEIGANWQSASSIDGSRQPRCYVKNARQCRHNLRGLLGTIRNTANRAKSACDQILKQQIQ